MLCLPSDSNEPRLLDTCPRYSWRYSSITFVIVITERTGRLVQHNFVEYRGVRFAILLGTARQQWRVAIYPVPSQLPEERTVFGTRQEAVTTARSMIDARLKKLSLASRTGRSEDNG